MKRRVPLRLGLAGAFCLLIGLTWLAFWFIQVPKGSPSWLTVDNPAPVAPRLFTIVGILLIVTSLAWMFVSWTKSKNSGV